MQKISRTSCLLVVGLGLGLVGCEDDPVNSDLNTEGPPRVISLLVLTESSIASWDGSNFLPEVASFCSSDADEKLSAFYCGNGASDVTDAVALSPFPLPGGGTWHVRVVFNELLEADLVEDILSCRDLNHDGRCGDGEPDDVIDRFGNPVLFGSLAATQPVNLTCGGTAIAYDGWYDPSGNHLTDPPGPALIIQALDYAATSSTCEITINADKVRDKDSNAIRSTDPFSFGIAPLRLVGSDPADGATGVDPAASVELDFNGLIDEGTVGNITLTGGTTAPTFTAAVDGTTVTLVLPTDQNLEENTEYTVTVDSSVADIGTPAGGLSGAPYTRTFTTGMLPPALSVTSGN